jgi:RHS repeat-associated protein
VYRFSSKELHVNSGLYYYGYRWYHPNLQRWMNRDPIEEEGDLNLYRFAANNAVAFVDPFGRSWLGDLLTPDGRIMLGSTCKLEEFKNWRMIPGNGGTLEPIREGVPVDFVYWPGGAWKVPNWGTLYVMCDCDGKPSQWTVGQKSPFGSSPKWEYGKPRPRGFEGMPPPYLVVPPQPGPPPPVQIPTPPYTGGLINTPPIIVIR